MKRFIFAGGCPRSGLTLLRAMLDAHPGAIGRSETSLLPGFALQWREVDKVFGAHLADAYAVTRADLAAIYTRLTAHLFSALPDDCVVIEKFPVNIYAFRELAALFPAATFVHVVRDGRDVVASLLATGWKHPTTGAPLPYAKDAVAAARYWAGAVQAAGEAAKALGTRLIVLRYEDLVAHPKRALRPLLAAAGLAWSDAMLGFHRRTLALTPMEATSAAQLREPLHAGFVGRWKRDLTPTQHAAIAPIVTPLLMQLGYRV